MKRLEWTAGDANVARLLSQPYDPPSVPADFAERVHARLQKVAAEIARRRSATSQRAHYWPRWSALAAAAVLLGIIGLGLRLLPGSLSPSPRLSTTAEQQITFSANQTTTAKEPLSAGTRIATGRGERRRVVLSDGSLLSLNENTRVHHDALHHLKLQAGEIFVEVAPRPAGKDAVPFTVSSPDREVRATGTKFLVRANAGGTGVAVTQGHVRVSDCDGLLSAGQQLAPKTNTVTATPRLSYLLDWTRDLVVAATPPLVPPSAYAGGALVAVDPQGQTGNLRLRKYHIDVHIEDGFARTTIDQTYFNATFARLEGTFFFPLPPDASLSRLVMYVDGQRMEGGMVERDYGRIVFDQIVTKMKDPALLEWVDGHTFKMRVFPLEPRQEKRIILSYTQLLPSLYDRWSYRFPSGHSLGTVRDWSFHARIKHGKDMAWQCDSHALKPTIDKDDLLLDGSAKQTAMDRNLMLHLVAQQESEAVRFSTMTQDGHRYLMLRYRPNLPGATKRQRCDWVFLFESSAERDSLLARTQVEIVRTLLTNAERDDTFAILTANTQPHAFAAAPLRATPENVTAALVFLEKTHLLGALDLDAGLTAAAAILNRSEHPVLVHLGCGRPVLGERRTDVLAHRLPQQACYVGVGVGRRGASDFMRHAAERCRGYVTAINPDDPVAWRAFDLLAALNTPRMTGVRVEDSTRAARFLCPNSIVAQGEELCAITRLPVDEPLPQTVNITGLLDGRTFREELRVESPRPDGAYLPRTWARLEIDRLLAEDAATNKASVIALSKAMYVMTPYTSLLVLENEAMYAQYKVDRGRKDHWAMYPCPAKIPIVTEWPSGDDEPYKIQLEPPTIYRAAISVGSDAELQERIRQENREGPFGPHIGILRAGASPGIDWSGIMPQKQGQSKESDGKTGRFIAGFVAPTEMSTQWMMNPYQGYLQGAADITGEQASYWQGIQQAKLTRQEAIRSSIDTRRPMIEEAEWERAHTPDPEKIRQQALERELDRARSNPRVNFVWSARAHNARLDRLFAQQSQVAKGPIVSLDRDVLDHINFRLGDGSGNIGLLKDNGFLECPEALWGERFKPARERLIPLMQTVRKNASSGKAPDKATLDDLRANHQKMKDTLNASLDQVTPDGYIEAVRYLKSVGQAIEALKEPSVVAFFKGDWKSKAPNVAELVRFMHENKLTFAPATPKDEPAYVTLYEALAAFEAGLPYRGDNPVLEEAERSLARELTDPVKATQPSVWLQAALVAEQRKQYDSALQRLRRALVLGKNRSRDLVHLRGEFAWFLSLADQRVKELTTQHHSIPRELIDGVMDVADQWRALDAEDWRPCWLAGQILRLAGERDVAWAYLTSPLILQQSDARAWHELARLQREQKAYDFAERAFAVARSLEPSNAERRTRPALEKARD